MPRERYRTVAGRGRTTFEVRGSEFIGHAAPARSVTAAEAFIEEIGAAYADATHTVPAYRVRADPLRAYSSDDGEPTGSAGKPALNVLEQRGLENVVVVIARYFGGTELGVGGLARAYGRGAKDAIEAAGVTEREPHDAVRIEVAYDDSGTVRGLLESAGVEFEAEYDARVVFEAWVPASDTETLLDRIRSATSGRADIDIKRESR